MTEPDWQTEPDFIRFLEIAEDRVDQGRVSLVRFHGDFAGPLTCLFQLLASRFSVGEPLRDLHRGAQGRVGEERPDPAAERYRERLFALRTSPASPVQRSASWWREQINRVDNIRKSTSETLEFDN